MKKKLLFLFLLLLLLFSNFSFLESPTSSLEAPHPPLLKGMALGLFNKDPNYDYHSDLIELKKWGVNSILLTVNWYQQDIRANEIEPRPDPSLDNSTPPDEQLVALVERAHALGMKVMLFPYLRFDLRGPKEWRGVLAPTNFQVWSKNYERFILHYAELAQRHGVELLSVGSELGSLEEKRAFWVGLIEKVRGKYSGKLLYSANWDHYTHPVFWDQLDYIGLTSYHKLAEGTRPSDRELLQNWMDVKTRILSFKEKYHPKLILTEVGYPSVDGTANAPWNYFSTTQVDTEEQAQCYRAFIEAWNGSHELEGVFWWVWFGEGGPQDKSYTPRGKPAEAILKNWYMGNK